jgi:hypothetical protein
MTEHISKITERYIKMAYSKHKMTEYRDDGGLGAAMRRVGGVNMGSAHRSMYDESEARVGARVDGERAGARVGGARTGAGSEARTIGGAQGWLDRSVG